MEKGFALTLFSQLIRFMDRYYRFPKFVMVGPHRVDRDDILLAYKRLSGEDLTWYKRKVCRCELCAVMKTLRNEKVVAMS